MRAKTGRLVHCLRCSSEFYAKKYKLDAGEGRFCSRSCANEVDFNEVKIVGRTAKIAVENKRKGFSGFALIDAEDLNRVTFASKWYVVWSKTTKNFYVRANLSRGKVVLLHRVIATCPEDLEVDHINHDTLDCRKSNLRVCTKSENLQNRLGAMPHSKSGIRNVYWDTARRQWAVEVKVMRKKIFIGRFNSLARAKKAAYLARRRYITHSVECAR